MSSSGSFFRFIAWRSRLDTSRINPNLSFFFFLGTTHGNDGRTNWSSDRSERISFVKPTLPTLTHAICGRLSLAF